MQSHPEPAPVGAADLRQLTADLAAAEHHLARAVVAAGRLAGSGVCEQVEGLPLELFIGLASRMTGADRAVLIGAGQVLAQMPVTAAVSGGEHLVGAGATHHPRRAVPARGPAGGA